MSAPRKLTAAEIALAREAFGDKIDYGRVRLCEGPGREALAYAAFAKGNPAITVGSTIYFKERYAADFAAPGSDRRSFIHEMTHVWQYQTLGMPAFFVRYGVEFAKAGGDADKMYRYKASTEPFAKAMLEAQAEMVADYGAACWRGDASGKARLAGNLRGCGLYQL